MCVNDENFIKNIYMKNILGAIGVLIFTIFSLNLSAQVYYYYDNNGNRITTTNTHHAPQKRPGKRENDVLHFR